MVATASSFGNAGRTLVDISDLFLPPGVFGVGVFARNARLSYYNSASVPNLFSNNDLTLSVGSGQAFRFLSPLNNPRQVPVALHYQTNGTTAGYGFFGEGCPGSSGTPELYGTLPRVGTTFQRRLFGMPPTGGLALLLIGLSRTSSSFGALPLDLGVIGAPGCLLRVSPDLSETVVQSGGAATISIGIPNDAALVGADLFHQAIVIDSAAGNALGAIVSHAGQSRIGS